MVVAQAVKSLGLTSLSVDLGEVQIKEALTADQKWQLDEVLQQYGFLIIDDRKSRLIERIKKEIITMIHYSQEPVRVNLSQLLSSKLHHDYSYLSKVFSEIQGITIEHFFITQRIERVKELLVYDELSLSQIADQLNYSSGSHLSKQFKKITGLTPTHYRKVKEKKRTPIDDL